MPTNVLYFHAFVEPEVGNSDTEPGNQTGGSSEVGEPGKDNAGTVPKRHVGKECKASAGSNSDMGQSRARRPTENPWSTTRDGKTV